MVEKVDLAEKYPGANFPPDIAKLIKQHGSVWRAEKVANIGNGQLLGIANGKQTYTDGMKARIKAALSGTPMPSRPVAGAIPDNCPPLLGDLIRAKGSKKAAMDVLGTSDGSFYAVMNSTREMPPAWIVRAKAELGQTLMPVHVAQPAETQGPQAPEFVPWDGKKMAVVVLRGLGGDTRKQKVPEPVAKFLERFNGSRSAAAAAVGRTAGWMQPFLDDPAKFSLKQQMVVHNGIHGIAPPSQHSMGEDYDKYSLGIAIVMAAGGNFDRIQDIADILNGRLVFRKNTKGGWLLIYKMGTEDLAKFKRLALRDANEIVCP